MSWEGLSSLFCWLVKCFHNGLMLFPPVWFWTSKEHKIFKQTAAAVAPWRVGGGLWAQMFVVFFSVAMSDNMDWSPSLHSRKQLQRSHLSEFPLPQFYGTPLCWVRVMSCASCHWLLTAAQFFCSHPHQWNQSLEENIISWAAISFRFAYFSCRHELHVLNSFAN